MAHGLPLSSLLRSGYSWPHPALPGLLQLPLSNPASQPRASAAQPDPGVNGGLGGYVSSRGSGWALFRWRHRQGWLRPVL